MTFSHATRKNHLEIPLRRFEIFFQRFRECWFVWYIFEYSWHCSIWIVFKWMETSKRGSIICGHHSNKLKSVVQRISLINSNITHWNIISQCYFSLHLFLSRSLYLSLAPSNHFILLFLDPFPLSIPSLVEMISNRLRFQRNSLFLFDWKEMVCIHKNGYVISLSVHLKYHKLSIWNCAFQLIAVSRFWR